MRLARKAFKAWLEAQPPHKLVGHRGELLDCPLANFLHCAVGNGERVLPLWAQNFIQRVDEDNGYIEAHTCLKLLEQ